MTRCVLPTSDAPDLRPAGISVTRIEQCVQSILYGARNAQTTFERRRDTRYMYPLPIRLIPLCSRGEPLIDEATFVLGKHLSPRGLDFYGADPLPYRRAITCFECGPGRSIQMLMELTWCRFCYHGWYENGGRFLQEIVPTTGGLPQPEAG